MCVETSFMRLKYDLVKHGRSEKQDKKAYKPRKTQSQTEK